MRPNVLSTLAMTTMSVMTVMALGLGACAGSRSGNPCLDKCAARGGSSLERSTCELECKQTASTTAPGPVGQAPAPSPGPGPALLSDPAQPQPAQPTGPKQYAGDTGPRQAPPGGPAVRPATPQPGTTSPSTPPGPSMAELQAQRSRCEGTCDADNASSSDRSTCRLQCAQITNRPSNTNIPPSTGTSTGATSRPAPADRASIAACEVGCNSESTPATDRATCRLNCNAVGTLGPPPTKHVVLHGDAPGGTSRAEVIRSSGGVVK